jgi:hypothetical protein
MKQQMLLPLRTASSFPASSIALHAACQRNLKSINNVIESEDRLCKAGKLSAPKFAAHTTHVKASQLFRSLHRVFLGSVSEGVSIVLYTAHDHVIGREVFTMTVGVVVCYTFILNANLTAAASRQLYLDDTDI